MLRSQKSGIVKLALVVPIMAMAVSGFFAGSASAQDATPVPTPGVLTTEPASLDCTTAISPTADYAIVSEESTARYRAQEELQGLGDNEAVGETQAFIGNIYFDEAGLPLACSRWDVDLRTLVSDESRRDNFLRGNTLETETYPLATFISTSVEGLDQPLGSEDVTFTLIGDLTIHGVT
jgi:polyisoprenoid-binding protein YceI